MKEIYVYGMMIFVIISLLMFIGLLLSIPSISDFCEQNKTAWFEINIWKNENCARYWKEIEWNKKI